MEKEEFSSKLRTLYREKGNFKGGRKERGGGDGLKRRTIPATSNRKKKVGLLPSRATKKGSVYREGINLKQPPGERAKKLVKKSFRYSNIRNGGERERLHYLLKGTRRKTDNLWKGKVEGKHLLPGG